uniref:Uncharacterized protein n=1 Tax=Lotharella globosa TaxID=91324 RepID=A0A7S4DW68_9EUKA
MGHRWRTCTKDNSPHCPNCDNKSPSYKPHWPTDYDCPARKAKENAKVSTAVTETYSQVVQSQGKKVQQAHVRLSTLEKRMDQVEANDEVHTAATRGARMVVADVAAVALGKRTDILPKSRRERQRRRRGGGGAKGYLRWKLLRRTRDTPWTLTGNWTNSWVDAVTKTKNE